MYIIKCFDNVFSFNVKEIIYIHIYIILDFPILYGNASVLCQSACACLYKTVNMVVFFVKSNGNIYTKGSVNVQSGPYNDKREFHPKELTEKMHNNILFTLHIVNDLVVI